MTTPAKALADWFVSLPIPEDEPVYSSVPSGLAITISRDYRDLIVTALLSLPDAPRGREEMARAILAKRWPHRTDREEWIAAFLNGKSAGVPGKFYFDVKDAFDIADIVSALPPATPRPVEIEEVTAGREGIKAAITKHCHVNMKWPATAQIDASHIDGLVRDILAALPPAPADGVREALRHAGIDLSMMLPHANPEMQTSIRKTLVMIDAACINMSIDAAKDTAERTGADASADALAVLKWIREPDYAADFSFEQLADWLNRRPVAESSRLAIPTRTTAARTERREVEQRGRIHDLRVTLSTVVALAETGGVTLKTMNVIAHAAKHSLTRDAALSLHDGEKG